MKCPVCNDVNLSSAPPTQQLAHGSRDYEDRKKKKRKNLLGELFDF